MYESSAGEKSDIGAKVVDGAIPAQLAARHKNSGRRIVFLQKRNHKALTRSHCSHSAIWCDSEDAFLKRTRN